MLVYLFLTVCLVFAASAARPCGMETVISSSFVVAATMLS